MQKFLLALGGAGLLLAAGPLAAQPGGPLHLTQTVDLGTRNTVTTTVALPNHDLVLFVSNPDDKNVVAHCLAPDGRTRWQTTLTRIGRHTAGYVVEARRHIAISREARDHKQLEVDRAAAELYPLDVFTTGNEVVLAETITKETAKRRENAALSLSENQIVVQRLDEQGHLTRQVFTPPPVERRVEVREMGGYANAAGYTQVVREVNEREKTTNYVLVHCELASKQVRREPVALPAIEKKGYYGDWWYCDWVYLGHRPGQTYFAARYVPTVGKGEKQRLRYQVFIADDHGVAANPGGFTTTLNLSAGTRPGFSRPFFGTGGLRHIPLWVTRGSGNRTYTTDIWDESTGGVGTFHLDPATGQVVIAGEYVEGDDITRALIGNDLLGFFARRYAPDGRVLAQVQTAYDKQVQDERHHRGFNDYRCPYFHPDPRTGGYVFSYPLIGNGYDKNNASYCHVALGPDLQVGRFDYPSSKNTEKLTFTNVEVAQDFAFCSGPDGMRDDLTYEHAGPGTPPAFAALEQRRRAAPDEDYYQFFLAPTDSGKGLVVEQPQGLGGKLNVYTY